ncbi:hypothetical protein REPUB_Repub01dG0190100 [Reevesia pubescens]
MTPTLKEYSVLLQIKPEASHRIHWKEQGKSRYHKRVYQILGFEYPKKIDDQGIPWTILKKHIMETNNQDQASELFALAIYGLIVFPKILGHIEGSVVDFCGQVNKSINPASSILAETIRTLNFCRRKEKRRLIGCTQLIYVWLQSHFWGEAKVPRCPYSSLCEPVKEFLKMDWPKGITKNE